MSTGSPSLAARARLAVTLMIGFYLLAIGVAGLLLYISYGAICCWSCRQPLPVTEARHGHRIRCPECGTSQKLPG
jgi:Zn finger protein HypA/HybF involved in hydrogenase expression